MGIAALQAETGLHYNTPDSPGVSNICVDPDAYAVYMSILPT